MAVNAMKAAAKITTALILLLIFPPRGVDLIPKLETSAVVVCKLVLTEAA